MTRRRWLHAFAVLLLPGLLAAEEPGQGFFRGNVFLHPGLELRFEMPGGWDTSREDRSVTAASPDADALVQLTFSGAGSLDAAAEAFYSEEGVERVRSWEGEIHGLPALWTRFAATDDEGRHRGFAVFLEHQGQVFEIVAVAESPVWKRYRTVLEDAVASFSRLPAERTDQK